jgi:hypothetical protein
MTSGGISEYFVLTMNSATDFVSPGAFGNSAAGGVAAERLLAPIAKVDSVSEFLNKSRRFITAYIPSLVDGKLQCFRNGSIGRTSAAGEVFLSLRYFA